MLQYERHLKVMKGLRHDLSDYHVLCKLGWWIHGLIGREIVNSSSRIRSEKLKKHQYIEGYFK